MLYTSALYLREYTDVTVCILDTTRTRNFILCSLDCLPLCDEHNQYHHWEAQQPV